MTITKERLLKIQHWREIYGAGSNVMLPTEEAAELARIALASLEREQVRREHAEWSDKTFGDVGPVGPLKHLSKEALEAAAEPDDLSEWADMQFLLWDAQRRAGISDGEITAAMEEKLKVNMARQWPEPKDGEPRLHIKEQPVPVVPEERPSLNNGIVGFDEGWNACRAAMLQGAEPVSQTYNLPELIEGMEVSIDVSTCDADAGNRYFGTVTEISELYTAKNGYILLVQDAEPNFDVNGNSPVTPDSWISCSERMPEQGAYISAVSKHGEYVAGQVIDDWLDLHDGTSFGLDEVYLWMMLPPLPASPQQ
ncbi:TPA: DUF550 domain-containing protein [Salmonella enterica subsp. enterica serovar Orion]|nr:DUF550 domain-containing protein [Salmonella enterica]HEC7058511.1 DUF550 domain-containing protein [Salmonella enterica subsp. enterica serovar Orion]HEC7822289.1 DUF550 domain-containing protein [Salmonella enterica subsp. enterica serovar Orion]HEC8068656.1 DUF550 domain-containing protein [Salmonella enterica subsp. enterica serovar Orion]HEC9158373.1 DUF550 domain-containing protein [Salmonella enterica subsp. enterica serovar Orion]